MAEEQVQVEEAAPLAPPNNKKKSPFKLLIIVLVVLGVGGGAGYFFYGRFAITAYLAHKKAEVAKIEKTEKAEIGPLLALEPFIINVSGNPGKFVKIQVAVETKDEKVAEHAKKLSPIMRDAMLSVLGAKAPEVFMDVNGRPAIKKELLDVVTPLFAAGDLKSVYITDIVMQ